MAKIVKAPKCPRCGQNLVLWDEVNNCPARIYKPRNPTRRCPANMPYSGCGWEAPKDDSVR